MIIQSQESAVRNPAVPDGSVPCCAAISAIARSTSARTVPGSPLRAARGAGKRQVRSPRFPVVRSDGPAIHRAECCLAIFPLPWLVPAGTGAGAAARPCSSPHGRLSRSLLFGRLFPAFPHLAADPPDRVWPVPPCRVSDTRSKHLKQEDSINGYQQNPQRNSGSEPSRRPFGKTRSAGSPGTTPPFLASTATRASGRPRTASSSTTC